MEIQQQKEYARLDEFRIIKQLGSGLEATVKLGEDSNGIKVAIKKYKTQMYGFQAVENEIKIIKNFNHENIVRLIACRPQAKYTQKDGSQQTCIVLIFEYAAGGQLFDYIADSGRFSQKVARSYFGQIMNGLHHMHQKGFVHRDLKPQNLLLTQDFKLKIGDFGFSCHKIKHNGVLRSRLGTHGYMAPEIYELKYDGQKTDIFAVGVILFVMFVGGSPFNKATKQDPFYSMIVKKLYDKFWKQFEKRRGKGFFSSQFKDLIEKMIAFDPAQRLTIVELAQHPWIKGEIPNYNELKTEFEVRKNTVTEAIQKRRISEQKKRQQAKKQMNSGQGNIRGSHTSDIQQFVDNIRAEVHMNRKVPLIEDLQSDDMVIGEELSYVVIRLKQFLNHLEIDVHADPFEERTVENREELLHLEKVEDNEANEILAQFQYESSVGDEEEQLIVQKLVVKFSFGKDQRGNVVLRCEGEEGDWFYCRRVIAEVRKIFAHKIFKN